MDEEVERGAWAVGRDELEVLLCLVRGIVDGEGVEGHWVTGISSGLGVL